jgi:hypothetical protein
LTDVANELRDKGALDEEECFIDAMFSWPKVAEREERKRRENHGDCGSPWLAALVSTHAANHHEVRLVQLCFAFYMIEAKSENLVGDRAYDSDPLDEELRNDGIEMIAPHRSNRRKPATQDRRRLSRTCNAGWSSAFLPAYNGNLASSSAGNITPTTSSASRSLPASLSSSDDFENGMDRPCSCPIR